MNINDFDAALKGMGIDPGVLNKYAVVLLPENLGEANKDDLVFANDALDLFKLLKEMGVNCATPRTFGLDVPLIDRRSGDKWFGKVWIRDVVAIPLVVTIIGNLCTNAILNQPNATGEPPGKQAVHAQIIIGENTNRITHVNFTGDGDILLKIVQSLAPAKQ